MGHRRVTVDGKQVICTKLDKTLNQLVLNQLVLMLDSYHIIHTV